MSTSKLLFWGLVAVMSTFIIIKVVLLVNANRESILRGFSEVSFKNLTEFVMANSPGAFGVILRVFFGILIPKWNITECATTFTSSNIMAESFGNIICTRPRYESDDPPPNPNT